MAPPRSASPRETPAPARLIRWMRLASLSAKPVRRAPQGGAPPAGAPRARAAGRVWLAPRRDLCLWARFVGANAGANPGPISGAIASAIADAGREARRLLTRCSQELFWMTVEPDSGRPCSLQGRYFNTLVELDMDGLRVRALEPMTRDQPEMRAANVVAAFTVPDGATGAPRSSVLCGFGYTTFDPASQSFRNVRPLADVWECVLQGPRPPPPCAVAGAAGRPGANWDPPGPVADPTGRLMPGRAQIVQFDLYEVFEVIRVHVLRNDAARRFLSELVPRGSGRGALVGALLDGSTGQPVSPERFFAREHLAWLSEAQLRARFPDLDRHNPELAGLLQRGEPDRQVFLVCVGVEGELARNIGEPYILMAGLFDRWQPGAVYISGDHLRETGELRLSKLCLAVPGEVQTTITDVAICALGNLCPNLGARMSAHVDKKAAPPPRLKECSRCRLVKYCGAECQRLDWQRHKKECLAGAVP
jgi:hypothetical protein